MSPMTLSMRSAAVAAALLVAACAEMPKIFGGADAPKPAAPQITESSLRDRAAQQLADGVKQYEAGDYDNAVKNLTASLEHGLLSKADQSRARKYLAFSHCVSNREVHCRDEFRKAFEIYPDFVLAPAEDGHPIWGPIYRNVRTQLVAEREAAAARKPGMFSSLAKAEQMLADGMAKYDAGDYPAAHTLYTAALKEGLKTKEDQVRAMKHMAFTLCLENKFSQCRAEFVRIYEVDPKFDLPPAEAGHPSWTRTFASAKAQAKKAREDKEQKEAREKSKGTPPTAGVKK
ncbi:MAG: TssQ family T6SS-associated lipoprotein [Burkholderiales bacterium]|nr:TssQ family T6SS-associated lipoprotein [Burkholderiales bacterium]